eukprot:2339540-Lingulodinium_polyedra.AAC.1
MAKALQEAGSALLLPTLFDNTSISWCVGENKPIGFGKYSPRSSTIRQQWLSSTKRWARGALITVPLNYSTRATGQ